MKKKSPESFEAMKAELEEISAALEDSSQPYETLRELYERGEALASALDTLLSKDLENLDKKSKPQS